ncbi:MAG: hypothetical protein ABIR16_01105 [Dokdonella sp.]
MAVAATLGLFTFVASARVHAETESEPVLDATALVQPLLLSGPGFTVEPRVELRGYMGTFTINTKLGRLNADSVEVLAERVAELPALEALDEVTRTEAFAEAAGDKLGGLASAMGNVVLHPLKTVAGIGSGVARYLGNRVSKIGDQAQAISDRAARRMGADGDPYAAGDGPMTDSRFNGAPKKDRAWYDRTGAEAERELKRQLSYGKMKRDIARRLGIDPYTANPYIHLRLDSLAWVASGGNYAVTAAIGTISGGTAVAISQTTQLNDLVWKLDPDDIRERVADRLGDTVSDEFVIRQFVRRGVYTPTLQLAIVDAIDALKPTGGVDALLELAIGARSELEARFIVNALRMLSADPQGRRGGKFVPVGAGLVWQLDDGSIVVPLPVDQLSWTDEIEEFFDRSEFRNSRKSVLIAAGASLLSRRELAERGWNVQTQVRWPGAPGYASDTEAAPMATVREAMRESHE